MQQKCAASFAVQEIDTVAQSPSWMPPFADLRYGQIDQLKKGLEDVGNKTAGLDSVAQVPGLMIDLVDCHFVQLQNYLLAVVDDFGVAPAVSFAKACSSFLLSCS